MSKESKTLFILKRTAKYFVALCLAGPCLVTFSTQSASADNIFHKLFHKDNYKTAANEPVAPRREHLISPPGERTEFPVRQDGQAFVLNVDTTTNMTDAINSFYFNPKWEGEVWAPFDQVELIERASRTMNTWPEYNSETMFRFGTGVAKLFERWSGFGP